MSEPTYSVEKLRWRCRRGMLELDVLFQHYLSEHYPADDSADQQRFCDLLDEQDPVLQRWLLQGVEHPDPDFRPLISRIRSAY
ncbi:MAG: succinate dehydrogenase assembly factor 2 [Gammaproteobacteria bacterium]|nr:succinate dehydrogenase assembly factor 2 [Gammaproteobacteria bacterium]